MRMMRRMSSVGTLILILGGCGGQDVGDKCDNGATRCQDDGKNIQACVAGVWDEKITCPALQTCREIDRTDLCAYGDTGD
jgi:PBP1b-binding outer membrane lipoprotein LpoB